MNKSDERFGNALGVTIFIATMSYVVATIVLFIISLI